MINVLYCGDSSANVRNIFYQSPFFSEQKGLDVKIWGEHLIKALESDPEIRVTHMPSWVAYRDFPIKLEELMKFDVIILSDVENIVLTLYEQFFPSTPEQHLVLPNRVKLIAEFVEQGGGFVMGGGWLSYTGRMGVGGWHKTAIANVLPVHMLGQDDEIETPEGAIPQPTSNNHPIMKGLDWSTPPIPRLQQSATERGRYSSGDAGRRKRSAHCCLGPWKRKSDGVHFRSGSALGVQFYPLAGLFEILDSSDSLAGEEVAEHCSFC